MAKTFYITTAIDYVNAPTPHLGHALEKVQADVLARYHRLLGEDVFFLTGTDENAQKNVLAAERAGVPIEKFIDQNTLVFKKLAEVLNISNNDFIRTADKKRHWPGAQKLWRECNKTGDIYKKSYKGLYCVGCEAFVTNKDLENGLCPEHQEPPEKISEENYFFKLSKYQEKLENIITTDRLRVIPETRKNEILTFIRSGLEDLSVSRPTERVRGWGIPVPEDKSQIQYVWMDALSNYITALGYGAENPELFKKYWPADIHAIGKGILRFHAVYWPAFLMSAGIELPKNVFVHEYITVAGQKMSKSLGTVINPIELVEKYGTDPVRYFLLREFSPFVDGDFTYKKFEQRYNADLAKGLGNLVRRVLTMAEMTFGEEEIACDSGVDFQFQKLTEDVHKVIKEKMAEFRFNEALTATWSLIGYCDQYIQEERVWEKKDEQPLKNLLVTLAQIALFLEPFLPDTSKQIFEKLGTKPDIKDWRFRIKKGEPLFPKLEQ